ncbi:MAG TPA: LCP family protein [Thermomicrobiales bacterium]|nr:LCP family protein [Thermomicrobiales bacterium]
MANDHTPEGPAPDSTPLEPEQSRRKARKSSDSSSVTPQQRPHYLTRKRPSQSTKASSAQNEGFRPPRRAQERYRTYGEGHRDRRTLGPSASPALAGALAAEFRQAEREQQLVQKRPGNRLRRATRQKWFWPAVGVPGIALLVALIVLAPVVYSAFFAYQDVQVDSVERIQSAFVPQLNRAGTPELVAATSNKSGSTWTGEERITILLLGVDKSDDGPSRTDTLILVNIDPVAKTANMLSIPRDLKTVIPGYGVDKINAAFALGEFNQVQGGGAGLTIRTIEANLGIPINAFVQIDFNGFINMVDTVGGITVDVPYPIKDDTYPADNYQYQRIYFPAGWQQMDGEKALQYARTRHQDGDSRRSARQQQVILSLRDQAIDLDLIPQLPTLIGQFGDSVRTDISIGDAVKLARLGTEIPRGSITQTSLLPALWEEQVPDGPYYLNADWDAVGDVLSGFAGTEISPPGAALVNPDYGAPILIENGTNNEGLAGRIGDILEANGFWNIEVVTAEDAGSHEKTMIQDRENNLGTSSLITQLIGVGADTITLDDGATDVGDGTGPTDNGNYAIVITLGNDAPDPAGDEWNLEDYQRESGNDGAAIEEDPFADDGALEEESSQEFPADDTGN